MSESRIVMTNEPLSKRVARLEEENQESAEHRRRLSRQISELACERDELAQRIEQVEAERDYRAEENKELYENLQQVSAVPVVPVKDFSIPRVITAEELREGQVVATHYKDTDYWEVDSESLDKFLIGNIRQDPEIDTIVLLADVHEPDPEVTADTIGESELLPADVRLDYASFFADESFRNHLFCAIAEWHAQVVEDGTS